MNTVSSLLMTSRLFYSKLEKGVKCIYIKGELGKQCLNFIQ